MPAECYELVISGVLSGQFVQNVMHVNIDNSGSTNPYTVAQDLLATLDTTSDLSTFWNNCLPTDYRITSWRARRVLVTGGPTAIRLAGDLTTPIGQRSGSIQAAQVNPVMVWLTTINPSRPGKTFLPGLSETDCDDMTYTAGIIAEYQALIDLIVANFTLDTLTYASNFSIFRRGSSSSNDITAGRISPLIGTQRRRLRPV